MRILLWPFGKTVPSFPFASPNISAPLAVSVGIGRVIHALFRSVCPFLVLQAFLLCIEPLAADPVQVHKSQGTFHGFLVLKTPEGKTLASGDLVQVAHGETVTSRLTFHFREGSLDDEVAIYSQHKVFQLISDHHVQ